jgi:hypothetical protein
MRFGKSGAAAVLLGLLAGLVPAAPAWPALSGAEIRCSRAIARTGLAFVRSKLKLQQRCRNAALANGSCTTPAATALAKVDRALQNALARRCGIAVSNLAALGFPGPCADDDVGNGFTRDDLESCIRTSHDAAVNVMVALQYDPTVTGPLGKSTLACQQEIGKQSAGLVACVLRSVQRCRAGVSKGKLPGVPAHLCASEDPKTAVTIAQCRAKLEDGLRSHCSEADVAGLHVCGPDQTTIDDAASCLIEQHTLLTDGPAIDVPADLIDYEYAARGGLCGDGVVNSLDEECDGADDAACPGACGAPSVPDGYFACLCKDKPRLRIVEHAEADTDNGWTGSSADTGVVEGGGYLVDLYDCDGSGLCTVGPSCSLAPHSPCAVAATAPSGTTSDSVCAALGQGGCRKARTAVGPHCFQDIQKKCDLTMPSDPVCDTPGDFCAVTAASPPNPVASGGVTVCNLTVFSEDVVGTANVLTGDSTMKARQQARTYPNLIGSANKPCPICGGFCGVSRERCQVNADCAPGKGPCVTAAVCSNGPNAGKTCRPHVPFGSVVTFFGTTSVDCPPDPTSQITSGGGLDLDVTYRTTGVATMTPTVVCLNVGFTENACLGGASEGHPCTLTSECPGGTCAPQCFCTGQLRPNACAAACVGGVNDAADCVADSECPGGFCHAADCRVDPSDRGSVQEGVCTKGPTDGKCSVTNYRACVADDDCRGTSCPFCEPGESCVFTKRACFVNSGIVRQGAPHEPEGTSVGIYCIAGNNPAVNAVAGFPGPAAFTQPELAISVP